KDHPWIGDPKDPARMESARKVRWAMAMAIDRQKIIETVMGGNARLIYTHANILPDSPLHKPEWVIPFDPDKAKQYLKEAGYPTGFSLIIWRAPNVPIWDPEIGDAIAEMWRSNLGLKVTVESTVYAARRPTTVDKTIDIPFIHGINYYSPIENVVVMIGANPGHILGIEVEDNIFEIGMRNDTETDLKKREQNTVAVQDYVSHWMLMSPVLQTGVFFVYRSEVLEWRPYSTTQEVFTNPESIVMK
ncbi:MAG: ABC transporter substrate-binding protein, partial [Chloroflexota bacterium]|nr:ABC transporter substrate-binding protein [Chloroflexota bacterium]